MWGGRGGGGGGPPRKRERVNTAWVRRTSQGGGGGSGGGVEKLKEKGGPNLYTGFDLQLVKRAINPLSRGGKEVQ